MAQWRKVVVSGSSAVLNEISASGDIVPISDDTVDLGSSALEFKDLYIDGTAYLDSATITAGSITGITDLVVADGGTGAGTFTDGGILIGSGTGPITAAAVLADGEILIGDGTTDPVALDIGSSTSITILGTVATGTWEATDVEVAHGGTGVSTLTDGGVLLGNGTGGIVAMSVLTDGQFIVGDGTTDPVAESGDTARISMGVGSTSTWQITGLDVGHATDTTVTRVSAGDLNIEGNIIYRAGGTTVPVADGGTGASSLSNLITMGTHTTGTYISTITPGSGVLLDQASSATSTETATPTLSIDSGSMAAYYSSSAFSVITGDIAITAGGVATVTGASTDAALTAGAGISAAGTFDGATARTFALDINELTAEVMATGDTIAFNDAGDNGQHKESIDDIATLFAGTGLSAASAVISIDAADTTSTSIINASLTKIGTDAAQEYVTFGSANEVNTFINNTERLSVTATGVDITGIVTVSSDLTVEGNLDVNGTVTTIDTANTYIADKFMIMASGSTSATDGGIIVQGDLTSGYALGYDVGVGRWAFDADLAHNATDLGPDAYVGVVQFGTATPDTQTPTPTYGGVTNGVGTIYVDTDDSEIWIYA